MCKETIKTTTNNSIYRKLLIKKTNCGYCGLGKGCNAKDKRKYYYNYFEKPLHSKRKDCRIPNWKLYSKSAKQWQAKKDLKIKVGKRDKNYYEYSW